MRELLTRTTRACSFAAHWGTAVVLGKSQRNRPGVAALCPRACGIWLGLVTEAGLHHLGGEDAVSSPACFEREFPNSVELPTVRCSYTLQNRPRWMRCSQGGRSDRAGWLTLDVVRCRTTLQRCHAEATFHRHGRWHSDQGYI
eukprot:scaffold3577_cov414-Prasinococcus_capsulatus_cf.AAC.12